MTIITVMAAAKSYHNSNMRIHYEGWEGTLSEAALAIAKKAAFLIILGGSSAAVPHLNSNQNHGSVPLGAARPVGFVPDVAPIAATELTLAPDQVSPVAVPQTRLV